jgi:phosphatidylserine synthase 2
MSSIFRLSPADGDMKRAQRRKSAAKVYQELVSHSSSQFRADVEFHEKPRQVFFGGLIAVTIFLLALSNHTNDTLEGARSGIVACIIAITMYCGLQSKDGLMLRPHPMIWRGVHGLYVAYFVFLVFFLVLPPKTGIAIIHDLIPSISGGRDAVFEVISAKAPAHLLPSECELTLSNIFRQINSVWFIAHVGGYWGKMCLFRDWGMCLTYSIAFEVVELSLVWLLPEFNECWWDSVFMDVLGANMLGMVLGHYTLRFLSCKNYDWEQRSKKVDSGHHLMNLLSRFTPFSWSNYQWPKDEKAWVLTGFTWISSMVIELNSFVLLHGLFIRPTHWTHTVRLWLIGAQAAQSVPEWYEYARGRTERIGHNCWLMYLVMVIESLFAVRYGKAGNSFATLTPPVDIVLIWSTFLILYTLWLSISSYRSRAGGARRSPSWLMYLRIAAHIPLIFLTRRWVWAV